jgi:DNA-binding NtrC family response regulator
MKSQRLLWITDSFQRNTPEWEEHLADLDITEAVSLPEVQRAFATCPFDCIFVSVQLPDLHPVEMLEFFQSINATVPVIFWEEEMAVSTALQLIRAGAYHCSNAAGQASVREYIDRALDEKRCRDRARKRTESNETWRAHLVGESREMEAVADTIRQIGPRRCTILISGETGTGKEMAARAVHKAGPRAQQQMVAINCSALPENLLEAELFGHVKGAFTGAVNHRAGRFEQADKGTLFLDEIGDMPLELQAKLLRALQEREVQRLGSSETIKVDVRVIAASNVDLLDRVRQGKFREDLYYRLNVVPVHMPPLRQRTSDIPLLVAHFVKKVCTAEGLPLRRVSPEALEVLKGRAWPGNVRELENIVEKAIVLSGERDVLTPADFGSTSMRANLVATDVSDSPQLPAGVNFESAVSQFELALLNQALKKASGNKSAAAEILGLKRTTLIMKLRNYENSGLQLKVAS